MQTYPRGTLIGPYRTLGRLPGGDGGMATIYLARPQPGCAGPPLVALKVAHDDGMCNDSLKYEVEHLRQFDDERILAALPISGLQTAQGQPVYIAKAVPADPQSPWYMVAEYMRGGALAQLLARRRRLRCAEAVEIAWQTAVALSRVHARQLVHLDIKPGNILLREPLSRLCASVPQVVLADFGIAWPTGHTSPAPLHGSQPYVAPERAAGEPPQPANDIFSLGVLFYEMVTGALPFDGAVVPGTPLPKSMHPAVLNRTVTPELEQVILRALATDPRQRYQNVRQLRRDLDALPQIERPGRIRLPLLGALSYTSAT